MAEDDGDRDAAAPASGSTTDAPVGDQVRERARELEQAGRPYARVTVVRREPPVSANVGDSAIVTGDGDVVGWVGGAECAESVAVREAKAAIESGEAVLVGLAPDPADVERTGMKAFPMTCHSGGTLELFVEPVLPGPELVVVGDSPVARAVARLGREVASGLTVVADADGEKSEEAAAGRRVSVDDEAAVADAVAGATYVVVASLGEYDGLGVAAGLRSGAEYVGLVASDRRRDEVAADVAGRLDVDSEDVVGAVTTPTGLDINARSPEEIAVSVLAELVALRRDADDPIRIETRDATDGPWGAPAARDAATASESDANETATDEETADTAGAGTVVDPVCGMDVTVDEDTPTVDHEGVTYHFCGQGCADAFAADPERFAPEGDESREASDA